MKRYLSVLALVIFMAFSLSTELVERTFAQQQVAEKKAEILLSKGEYLESEIIVQRMNFSAQSELKQELTQYEVVTIDAPNTGELKSKLTEYLLDPEIVTAQPNYIYRADWIASSNGLRPNDYNSTNHWYYSLSSLPEAWNLLECPTSLTCASSSDILVAVIDTGLAYTAYNDIGGMTNTTYIGTTEYSELDFYVNSGEEANPADGLDNDCNGFVDDVNGIDSFAATITGINNTCIENIPVAVADTFRKVGRPVDTYGHGSIVTGLIAGVTNNSTGSVSPAFNAKILPIAANSHFTNLFTTLSLSYALSYATAADADIINLSLGGTSSDTVLQTAINNAANSGALIIASSGNNGNTVPVYPASYPNVMSVGSVNPNDTRSGYSSFGNDLDLTAYVGQNIIAGNSVYQTSVTCYPTCDDSTIDTGITEKYTIGTSFAAPQASALAAMIMAIQPNLTPAEVKSIIVNTAKDIGTPGYDTETGSGVLNFYNALLLTLTGPDAPRPIYRFWSPGFRSHFYTIDSNEKSNIQFNDPNWNYEWIAFYAYDKQVAGTLPVYRFWSPVFSAHFYTMDPNEKALIEANDENWRYEWVAYYAYPGSDTDTKALYRFWSPKNTAHFFTADVNEKNYVEANDPAWSYEWIGYYVL